MLELVYTDRNDPHGRQRPAWADTTHRDLSRLQQGEVAAIFRELSTHLSEKQRLVFLLREVEGLSSQEVAEIVGCRESTVRNHLFNARKLLRRELVQRYPEYAAGWVATLDKEEVL